MKRQTKTNLTQGRCCRYHWQLIKGNTLSEFMLYNQEQFNKSWNVFSFYKDASLVPHYKGKRASWFAHGMIIFNTMIHQFKFWSKRVKWDKLGAWYYYSIPTRLDKKELDILYLQDHRIPLINAEDCETYFNLPPEWEFIHYLQPDLAIIQQGPETLMVIGLDRQKINDLILNLPWIPNEEDPF